MNEDLYPNDGTRSEERRVGKECRSLWSPEQDKKKEMNMRDFFFSSRRRHTRSKRDWSSDVCSSDLQELDKAKLALEVAKVQQAGEAAANQHKVAMKTASKPQPKAKAKA